MKTLHRTIFSFVTITAFCLPFTAQAEMFTSVGSPGRCLANAGGTPVAVGCVVNTANQNISMRYILGENVFYGQLNIGGQCLDAAGATLKFAACKAGDAQIWKLSGNSGLINNPAGICVTASGSSVGTTACSKGGNALVWWNLGGKKAKIIAVPNMAPVAVGELLKLSGDKLISTNGTTIVAAGAGNIVAGGAGNIVAGGAGNIVAGGAGN
jgi:hypothetical protein